MYVRAENVTKIIDGMIVLNDVNLEMEKGNIYGLHGKNGSGKTMLMRAICGLIRLNEGKIIVNGTVLGKGQEFPPSVGAVIENPGFINEYSGYKNLEILADMKGTIGKNEIYKMMEKIGLDPEEKKKVKKYSLGMKQKLGIVSAVMEHPELIVLDEPTNALDREGVLKLNEILEMEKKRGAVILISSHDQNELEKLSDKIFIMEKGKILEERQIK